MSATPTVVIDLNVRCGPGQTFSGFEDADCALRLGQQVRAVEVESGLSAPATVRRLNYEKRLVYLDVDCSLFG